MSVRILVGDVREKLKDIDDESVQCVVTSPPYWGLRDYGVAGQLGLEATPEEHVVAMVEVFREVRRVMRADGTLWLNYGDSYASWGTEGAKKQARGRMNEERPVADRVRAGAARYGLKHKDLIGMPWRVAFGLQADGWYLRSDIIWAKPNPMPESVTDRPTKSHEYIFLMTKSATYYYDADAVKEQSIIGEGAKRNVGMSRKGINADRNDGDRIGVINDGFRNLRDVWTIPTHAYSAAHFATFPPKLVEPCIKAGSSEEGCCSVCGAPRERIVERGELVASGEKYDKKAYGVVVDNPDPNDQGKNRARDGHRRNMAFQKTMIGWKPRCEHAGASTVPCTVLDPFGGAGTVGLVADQLGRDALLIELNKEYAEMARTRIRDDCPMFSTVEID